jgi:hypothetical protein
VQVKQELTTSPEQQIFCSGATVKTRIWVQAYLIWILVFPTAMVEYVVVNKGPNSWAGL